jgi:hypothetical protein
VERQRFADHQLGNSAEGSVDSLRSDYAGHCPVLMCILYGVMLLVFIIQKVLGTTRIAVRNKYYHKCKLNKITVSVITDHVATG